MELKLKDVKQFSLQSSEKNKFQQEGSIKRVIENGNNRDFKPGLKKKISKILSFFGESDSQDQDYERECRKLKLENEELKNQLSHYRQQEERLRIRCHMTGRYPFHYYE